MPDIPLFDSLTHPTLDRTWIGGAACNNTLSELETENAASNVEWACAVGMKGIDAASAQTILNSVGALPAQV